jgi:hypothetical protein
MTSDNAQSRHGRRSQQELEVLRRHLDAVLARAGPSVQVEELAGDQLRWQVGRAGADDGRNTPERRVSDSAGLALWLLPAPGLDSGNDVTGQDWEKAAKDDVIRERGDIRYWADLDPPKSLRQTKKAKKNKLKSSISQRSKKLAIELQGGAKAEQQQQLRSNRLKGKQLSEPRAQMPAAPHIEARCKSGAK